MKKVAVLILIAVISCGVVMAQTPQEQNKPADDVLRITTELVQVDAVVTDKNDKVIPDLKLSDFSLFENGKRQELKFIEYVAGSDAKPRVDQNVAEVRAGDSDIARNLSSGELHRVLDRKSVV